MKILFFFMCLVPALLTTAAPATMPTLDEVVVSKYTSFDVSVVIALDTSRINSDAVDEWLAALMDGANFARADRETTLKRLKEFTPQLRKLIPEFRQRGGRYIYQFTAAPNMADYGTYWVIPIAKGGDAEGLKTWLEQRIGPTKEEKPGIPDTRAVHAVIHEGSVLLISDSHFNIVRRHDVAVSPDLITAMRSAGDAPLRCVYVGTGTLPVMLNKRGREVIQGVSWASIAVNAPPRIAVHVVVQAKDADAAKQVREFVNDQLKTVSELASFRDDPDTGEAILLLKPEVSGDRLKLELSPPRVKKLFSWLIRATAREEKSIGEKEGR